MITARPWEDLAAVAVFRQLDAADHREAELVRGAPVHALGLFADWRAVAGHRLLDLVLHTGAGTPFAVLGLAHTGQGGVASAALLARHHARYARPLAQAVVLIRARLPSWCAEQGVQRIEARSWSGHPTAGRLLRAIGFAAEADMPGFGGDGSVIFTQWAWTARNPERI